MPITMAESTSEDFTPDLTQRLRRLDENARANGWTLTRSDSLPSLLVLSQETASCQRIGIVSSRLTRSFDQWPDWFAALRGAVAGIDAQREVLVSAAGTTTGAFVDRAAELFGQRVLSLDLPRSKEAFVDWIARAETEVAVPPKRRAKLLCSPTIPGSAEQTHAFADGIPLRDQLIFGICNKIIALHVRQSGFTLQLLQTRLRREFTRLGQTQIALGDKLVSAKIRDQLLRDGAVGLAFLATTRGASDHQLRCHDELTIESFAKQGEWTFLTHCTRRRQGPWPDQTQKEFLDDLILGRESGRHRPLDSLLHILQTDRLVASATSIQGTQEVVCFTAVPLAELQKLRVFRPHRGRWDFEPYGICIQRETLRRIGAAAVTYFTDTDVTDRAGQHGEPPRQTHRQRAESMTKSGHKMDWTVEQEWRYVGDLALNEIGEEQAFVFVPTLAEARAIQPVSRWPVVVLPTDAGADSRGATTRLGKPTS